jgi:uncharacterized protein with von Willebrand factor type A (vWA) domain
VKVPEKSGPPRHCLLRNAGVRVSVSETLDAAATTKAVGYDDRQILKDSLSASLAKSHREKQIFDDCFDRFFSGVRLKGWDNLSPAEGILIPDVSPLAAMILSGDRSGLSVSMSQAARRADINTISFFTQKSMYIQRILQEMGQEGLKQDIRRMSEQEGSWSKQSLEALQAGRERLFEEIRDFVEKQYGLFASSVPEQIMESYLRRVGLSNLEQRDFERMRHIIQKMVQRLNDRYSRRRKRAKRGALDLKATLRRNLAYQGLIFEPCWKSKKLDRPEFLVLCDVSRSVQAFSRFMLLFLYSLHEELARIRSFIFCTNLVEVSHVFEEYGVEEALVKLKSGTGLDLTLGRTDYGQSFQDFKEEALDRVSNKTTVIILGDARNNYGEPRTDILKRVHELSRRILWLNPEPPVYWGTGDSEMKRYSPYCFLVQQCSTVTHLERVVDFLLQTQG